MKKWIFVALLFVAACDTVEKPPRQIGSIVTGVAALGLVTGGTVTAYDFSKCEKGQKLAEFKLQDSNRFTLELSGSENMPVMLELSDITYIEEASGTEVNVRKDFLYSSFLMKPGAGQNASISYWTHLAHARTTYLCAQTPDAAKHVSESNESFSKSFDFDIIRVLPQQLSKQEQIVVELKSMRYGAANAAVSFYTYGMDRMNGETGYHEIYHSMFFSALSYRDLLADGLLDGQVAEGELVIGDTPVTADTYRTELPGNLKYAVVAKQILPLSQNDQVAISGDLFNQSKVLDVFPEDMAVRPIELIGPVVQSARIDYTQRFVGNKNISGCNTCFNNSTDPDYFVPCEVHVAFKVDDPRMAKYSIASAEYTSGSGTINIPVPDVAPPLGPDSRIHLKWHGNSSTAQYSTEVPTDTARSVRVTIRNEFGFETSVGVNVNARVYTPGGWYNHACSINMTN